MTGRSMLKGFPRTTLLSAIVVFIAISVAAVVILVLYRTAINEETDRLIEAAQSQARLIEAVARFDAQYNSNYPDGAVQATLKQISEAHRNYRGFGRTGEFTLAKREGDLIVFLLRHRHFDLETPRPISFDSELAEPMKMALSGRSGSMVGLDYRGKKVLAAYEPVTELDFGIVAKIDLAEIRSPYIRAGVISVALTLLIAALGVFLFTRITKPIIHELEESERNNRYLVETMTDGIGVLDTEYRFTFVNPRLCEMLGYTEEELLGRSTIQFLDRRDHKRFEAQIASRRRGKHSSYELAFIRKNGEKIITKISPRGRYDESGRYVGSFGVITDITEMKRTEDRIRRERDFAESLVETAQAIVLVLDMDGHIIRFNPYMQEITGYKLEEVRGKSWFTIFIPERDRERIQGAFSDAIEDVPAKGIINPILTKDGKERMIDWYNKTLKDSLGQTIGLLAVGHDLTERVAAENALRESEIWQRSIFEGSRDAILIISSDARIVDVNEAAVVLTGYAKEELVELKLNDLHRQAGKASFNRFFTKVMSGQAITNEVRMRRKDGAWVEAELSNRRIVVGGKAFMHTVARDITQRKIAQAALRESEMKFRALFENANDAIIIWDMEGRFVEVNKKTAEMLGYKKEEMVGEASRKFIVPDEHDQAEKRFQELISGGALPVYERTLLKKDGTRIPVELNVALIRDQEGKPLFAQSIARDITERKRAEKRIQNSLQEKEILLKEIHHRVKNNMQIMSSLLRLQAARIENDKMRVMYLESQSRIRSMSLIHEKLYQSSDFSQVNFADYVESLTVHLFQTYNVSPSRIRLQTELEEVFLEISKAIPCGLIVNELISNTLRHAFPGKRKGNIFLGLSRRSDDKVVIQIGDDGIGLPDDIEMDDPPSLGLQLVSDLTRQLEGKLDLKRKNGLRFKITF